MWKGLLSLTLPSCARGAAVLACVMAFPEASLAESFLGKLFGGREAATATAAEKSLADGGRKSPASADPALPVIPVASPIRQKVTEYIELTGNASPTNIVNLIARVEGYLTKIHFQDGQIVKKGDLLFTIQQDQYRSQLIQAEAQVRAQEAALAYARIEVERYTGLRRKGAAAQVIVDNWNFQAKKSEAELASAKAQVEIARLNLDYTQVRAPFDGQMGKHQIDPGNTVGGMGQPTVLAEIIQLDPIYVVANLSEQEVQRVRKALGDRRVTLAEIHDYPVDVGLEAGQDYPLHGHIQYVAPAIDPKTGTMLVRGILQNADHRLLPGFFVRIRLPAGKVIPNALLVPNRSVQTDQGGRYVVVANKDDLLEKRYVDMGDLQGEMRVILSGLTPDDRVVVADLWRATPGLKITPRLAGDGEDARP
ncbi:efflux RND transporter periplasmic adaptor subunit [Methylocystis parvus]|uniref:Efflux RND transporter periplasmic adaptor subunit n=1 Tax=Methylocystis parvus TaxID=134 RepID=A0A6B8M4U0_9HYPH|nr:efflux RND transporter periplasmic adaptor subunit [Methylocystis parvus]QGM96789.1 efflux RND transporter periplasmic adaptor subunit [Methylocystis parvus]WBJ99335.1 efflux RND transporter periplasmic adaptor subunit [Methylocystis parvus OBBP]